MTLGVAGVSGAFAEQVKVGFAAEPYPPFTSPDASGNWEGWEVDFQKAVCAEAKLDCVITPVAWDGIIPALTSGKIVIIIGSMSITEERLKTIDFSDKYYNTPTAVIGTKAKPSMPPLKGLPARSSACRCRPSIRTTPPKYFGPTASSIKEYRRRTRPQRSGRRSHRCGAGRLADARRFLKTEQGAACCELKGNVADDPAILGAGVGVGLRKGEDELKGKINAAIAAIRANGTYDAFSKKYFDFDIYGK
jgi:polar amino acid transport system substrate-binding protein